MATSGRIGEAHLGKVLDSALQQVNEEFDANATGYRVAAVEGKELEAKEPIFLELVQGHEKTPIGITHFIHLNEKFDSAPFQEIARTVEELVSSIFKAIIIHEKARGNPDVIITSSGTPFFKNGLNIEIIDEVLFIGGKQITFNGQSLEARRLCAEEGLTFVRTSNGDFEAVNPVDQRPGKGVFVDKDSGAIYRK